LAGRIRPTAVVDREGPLTPLAAGAEEVARLRLQEPGLERVDPGLQAAVLKAQNRRIAGERGVPGQRRGDVTESDTGALGLQRGPHGQEAEDRQALHPSLRCSAVTVCHGMSRGHHRRAPFVAPFVMGTRPGADSMHYNKYSMI